MQVLRRPAQPQGVRGAGPRRLRGPRGSRPDAPVHARGAGQDARGRRARAREAAHGVPERRERCGEAARRGGGGARRRRRRAGQAPEGVDASGDGVASIVATTPIFCQQHLDGTDSLPMVLELHIWCRACQKRTHLNEEGL